MPSEANDICVLAAMLAMAQQYDKEVAIDLFVLAGDCSVDGYYYNDVTSFVRCTGGDTYVQHCAPGSANR